MAPPRQLPGAWKKMCPPSCPPERPLVANTANIRCRPSDHLRPIATSPRIPCFGLARAPKLSPRSVASCLQPSPTAIIRSCRPSGLDATYCPAREVVLNHQRPGSRWLPNAQPCAFLPTANPRGVDSRAAGYPLRHQPAIAPFPARPPTQPRAPHPLRDT